MKEKLVFADELKKKLKSMRNASGSGDWAYAIYEIEEFLDNLPTIDPESLKGNKRMLPLDEVYRVIAGHSNYHGDAILAALTCIAEGKDVKPITPIKSLRPHGEWVDSDYVKYDGHSECIRFPKAALCCSNCHNAFKKELLWKRNYCPNCGAKMDKED